MKHGHNNLITGSFSPDIILVLGGIILIAGLLYLAHRKKQASDGLTPIERKRLDYPEDDILSMIRQHAGPITQLDLVETLPGDMDELTEAINGLEQKGFIQRIWLKEKGTYTVTAKPSGV